MEKQKKPEKNWYFIYFTIFKNPLTLKNIRCILLDTRVHENAGEGKRRPSCPVVAMESGIKTPAAPARIWFGKSVKHDIILVAILS